MQTLQEIRGCSRREGERYADHAKRIREAVRMSTGLLPKYPFSQAELDKLISSLRSRVVVETPRRSRGAASKINGWSFEREANRSMKIQQDGWFLGKSTRDGKFRDYEFIGIEDCDIDFNDLYKRSYPELYEIIKNITKYHSDLKLTMVIKVRLVNADGDMNLTPIKGVSNARINRITNVPKLIRSQFDSFDRQVEEWVERGSNWVLNGVISLYAKFIAFRPHFTGSVMALPKGLEGNKSLLNIKNESDNLCALW